MGATSVTGTSGQGSVEIVPAVTITNNTMGNVLNCVSDGATDVTATLQQQINATPTGGTLYLPVPTVYYKITDALTISKSITIIGMGNQKPLIKQATAGKGVLVIAASNVTIDNLNLQGGQYVTQSVNEVGILCTAPSYAASYTNIIIRNCTIKTMGMYGMLLGYINQFLIENNDIENIYYAAWLGYSVMNGLIRNNYINNVVGTPNAYGINITRLTTDVGELTTNPRSTNVMVTNNTVRGVINWEAFDTHSGQRIDFIGNHVYNCGRGIVVVDSKNSANVATYGPKDCCVIGNTINSGVTDGSAVYGIAISGSSPAVGTLEDPAEGIIVSGNTIRGFGFASTSAGIAVYLVSTRACVVNNNTIIEPGVVGIGLYYNNFGFTVNGNTVQDVWSTTQQTCCVKCLSDYNKGFIGNNAYVRGLKTAAHIMDIGLLVSNFANQYINVTKDYSEATTALSDPGSKTH